MQAQKQRREISKKNPFSRLILPQQIPQLQLRSSIERSDYGLSQIYQYQSPIISPSNHSIKTFNQKFPNPTVFKHCYDGYFSPKVQETNNDIHLVKQNISKNAVYPQFRQSLGGKIGYTKNQIQQLLTKQNKNLKDQNDYLVKVIRKMKEKQAKHMKMIGQLKLKIQKLEKQKQVYQLQYEQVKDYIMEGIGRMQFIVTQDTILKDFEDKSQITMSQNISQILDELNQKFQVSLQQYKVTQNPQVRKKSAEIAKQIKMIRMHKVGLSKSIEKDDSQYA